MGPGGDSRFEKLLGLGNSVPNSDVLNWWVSSEWKQSAGLLFYTCVESIARAVFMHSNPVLKRLGLEEMGP